MIANFSNIFGQSHADDVAADDGNWDFEVAAALGEVERVGVGR